METQWFAKTLVANRFEKFRARLDATGIVPGLCHCNGDISAEDLRAWPTIREKKKIFSEQRNYAPYDRNAPRA